MRKRESPLRRYSLAADPVSETAECVESQTLGAFPMPGHRRETFTPEIRPLATRSRAGRTTLCIGGMRPRQGESAGDLAETFKCA